MISPKTEWTQWHGQHFNGIADWQGGPGDILLTTGAARKSHGGNIELAVGDREKGIGGNITLTAGASYDRFSSGGAVSIEGGEGAHRALQDGTAPGGESVGL